MKTTYTTSDGQTFDSKAEAKAHEREVRITEKTLATSAGLINFLTEQLPDLTHEDVDAIVAAIAAHPSAFREAVAPMLRGVRKPRADAGVPRGRRVGKRPQVAAA